MKKIPKIHELIFVPSDPEECEYKSSNVFENKKHIPKIEKVLVKGESKEETEARRKKILSEMKREKGVPLMECISIDLV